MDVKLAEGVGFCGGVKRAMEVAEEGLAAFGRVWMDGPLVHNRGVGEYLRQRGVVAGKRVEGAPYLVRAHGISRAEREGLAAAGVRILDATCPRIIRSQRLVFAASERGAEVVLAGDQGHAEVRAVAGSAAGAGKCLVVERLEDVALVRGHAEVFFLAQTTFDVELFKTMAEELRRRFRRVTVEDTICRATHERQAEARRMAGECDAVVVVGDEGSANTRRLAEAVRAAGGMALGVEKVEDLAGLDFSRYRTVGVISGASTPGRVVEEVAARLGEIGRAGA